MTYGVRCAFVLGFFGVMLVPALLFAEGASGPCDSAYNACLKAKGSDCEGPWQRCMAKCNVGGGAVGSCNKDPECQLHCTESATSQGGKLSCCDGGPKHQNSCPNKVDGNCEPKKPEGGEGKMPELPKPPQGGGGSGGGTPSATTTEDCDKGATSTPGGRPCVSQAGGVGGYLSSIFSSGNANDAAGSVSSTLSSAADKLSSLFFGDDKGGESSATREQSGSVTVPSGGAQLAPQLVRATPINSGADSTSPSAQVTGFGSGGTAAGEQSGVMKAISETISGIGVTLRNLLSSFAL